MYRLTCTSPCKLNLYLSVGPPRPDGYHEVVTVMEPLSLSDRLTLRESEEGTEVSCDHPAVPAGRQNIVSQAVELIREATGIRRGISVRIEKRVPPAAGLGGGSANGAATLLALNRFWELGLAEDSLRELSARLGSDVPFFIRPRTSLCRGRGEEVVPLSPLPAFRAVVLKPPVSVSTKWAYGELDRSGGGPPPPLEPVLDAIGRKDLKAAFGLLYNAFEIPIAARRPEIARLLDFCRRAGAGGTVLAGSGSAVAALFEKELDAAEFARSARLSLPSECLILITDNSLPSIFPPPPFPVLFP